MQTEAVRAFVRICDLGSIQAAADALHVSQPAASKRIAALEQRLGHALFDRIGRGVALTEAGRAYLKHARELLAAVDDGARALDNLDRAVSGPLRLALSHHVGLHRMPPVLHAFVQNHPEVDPDIEFLDSEMACRRVANGERELAVITLPTDAQPQLVEHLIWDDPLRVFVSRAHPLASQPELTARALADWPTVLPPTESYTFAIVSAKLAELGVVITPRMTSHYLETLRMLADVGIGWTVLPEAMPRGNLVALSVQGLVMGRRLGAVRHPQRTLSNAARALLALLDRQRRDSLNSP